MIVPGLSGSSAKFRILQTKKSQNTIRIFDLKICRNIWRLQFLNSHSIRNGKIQKNLSHENIQLPTISVSFTYRLVLFSYTNRRMLHLYLLPKYYKTNQISEKNPLVRIIEKILSQMIASHQSKALA